MEGECNQAIFDFAKIHIRTRETEHSRKKILEATLPRNRSIRLLQVARRGTAVACDPVHSTGKEDSETEKSEKNVIKLPLSRQKCSRSMALHFFRFSSRDKKDFNDRCPFSEKG
ncbi:hypothetical protein CEXT_686421 [Caerostris extrusa]|uniref:Uncharacterized protein n=1 Tax=Caerostris extrusa TaxID=172846 RepID=A0AAV4NM79_CAEEX|nr:hypothetical protein CEXT_686421 [Caerostris extrusa]